MKKIIFICTSNKDRSPALENYFRENYPHIEYRSAGINKYFTTKKGTHFLTQEDIDWATHIVCCEPVHERIVIANYTLNDKTILTLELGNYAQGHVAEDYLTRAELILKYWLT